MTVEELIEALQQQPGWAVVVVIVQTEVGEFQRTPDRCDRIEFGHVGIRTRALK